MELAYEIGGQQAKVARRGWFEGGARRVGAGRGGGDVGGAMGFGASGGWRGSRVCSNLHGGAMRWGGREVGKPSEGGVRWGAGRSRERTLMDGESGSIIVGKKVLLHSQKK